MSGLPLGQPPAIATFILAPARAILRVVTAAYFIAAGAALLMDHSAAPPLGGLLTADFGPIIASFLFVAGSALLMNILVRPVTSLLFVYTMVLAGAHLGLAGTTVAPVAFWGDIALLALLGLTGATAGQPRLRVPQSAGRANVRPFPSFGRTADQVRPSESYAQAPAATSDHWDRDAA